MSEPKPLTDENASYWQLPEEVFVATYPGLSPDDPRRQCPKCGACSHPDDVRREDVMAPGFRRWPCGTVSVTPDPDIPGALCRWDSYGRRWNEGLHQSQNCRIAELLATIAADRTRITAAEDIIGSLIDELRRRAHVVIYSDQKLEAYRRDYPEDVK